MLSLNPPKLKKSFFEYCKAFDFEWQYYYKNDMNYSNFLKTTNEGLIIQKAIKDAEGLDIDTAWEYEQTYNDMKIKEQIRLEKKYRADLDEARRLTNKEMRKSGNYIIDGEGIYQVYEDGECVYSHTEWRGRTEIYEKEGFDFRETKIGKAIAEAENKVKMGENRYEYLAKNE
jgi:hypothetical protein